MFDVIAANVGLLISHQNATRRSDLPADASTISGKGILKPPYQC